MQVLQGGNIGYQLQGHWYLENAIYYRGFNEGVGEAD